MKDFDSLIDIWQAQKIAPEIDYKKIIEKNNIVKNKLKLKLLTGIILMFIGLLTILYLWINTPFSYLTTHLSLLIFLGCGLYYIFKQISNIKILNSESYLKTPVEYIEYLKSYKALRFKENTKNFVVYTILMSLGLLLYFIEFFTHVNTIVLIISVVATICWILLCYFYFQKIYIKKEEKTLQEMIDNLNNIKSQFD